MKLFKYAGASVISENGEMGGLVGVKWVATPQGHAVADVPAHLEGKPLVPPDADGLYPDGRPEYPEGTARYLVSIGFAQIESE